MNRFTKLLLLFTFLSGHISSNAQPAFPEAKGFAKNITGGRGGDVYHVTNLNDTNTNGTLRYGIQEAAKNGPLIIVFDISGNIELSKSLKIKNDNITIAGQTAPEGGITLSGYPFFIQGSSNESNWVKNIIIRYMRFRTGDFNVAPIANKPGRGNADLSGNGADGITLKYAKNIMLDHVSISWGIDETLGLTNCKSVTVQNSMIYEGLFDSYHSTKTDPNVVEKHSRTVLIRGFNSPSEVNNKTKGYSFVGNLLAHSNMRMPVVGGEQGNAATKWLNIEFVNNIIYNWGQRSGHTASNARIQMNYISNYLIAGLSTAQGTPSKSVNPRTAFRVEQEPADDLNQFFMYQNGNFMDSNRNNSRDGHELLNWEGFYDFETSEKQTTRFNFPIQNNNIVTATEAYNSILDNAGASFSRDATDLRIINHVKNNNGVIIDSTDDVGGLEPINSIPRPNGYDTDNDGMPNDWEISNGLNPNNATDRNNTNLSSEGYTNLEVFLNNIATATLAVDDFEMNDIVISPNPTFDEIQIYSPKITIELIKIYDVVGKEVFRKKNTALDNKITLHPTLATGTYIIKLHSIENSLMSKKIIIASK